MEYRKLISFGKSSYVVSLPKNWVRRNKLSKGDLIYIDENISNLVLHPKPSQQEDDKEIIIEINGKSIRQIQREIVAAYIRNHKTITLMGDEIKEKAKDIQNIVQNLVALEVMEQTSRKIVAKDFLNMKETDSKSLIRKMDIILRSMISDCKEIFNESGVYDSVYHRDNDINKLSFLLYRSIRFGIENPGIMLKKYSLNANDLLSSWWVTYNLEGIGDETKRIARYLEKMNLDKKMMDKFSNIFNNLERNYLDIMNSLYKNDSVSAHAVHERKRQNIKDCELFFEEFRKVEYSGYLVAHLKSLATNIHNIGRSIYQY